MYKKEKGKNRICPAGGMQVISGVYSLPLKKGRGDNKKIKA